MYVARINVQNSFDSYHEKLCAYCPAVHIAIVVSGAAWETGFSARSYCHGTTGEHKHSSKEQDDNDCSSDDHEHILDDDTDVAAQSQLPTLTGSLKTTSIVVV